MRCKKFNRIDERTPDQFFKISEKELPRIETDVLIIGAGAAGLFAGNLSAAQGLRTHILEQAPEPGRKLSISGGGHANFTNLHMDMDKFLAPPGKRFCSAGLKAWTPIKMGAYMRSLGFSIIEKDHGRLFLLEKASDLVRKLCQKCQESSCQIHCNEKIINIQSISDKFQIGTEKRFVTANSLILASGSPAHSSIQTPYAAWELAHKLGHTVIPPRPCLVPLLYSSKDQDELRSLAGIGVPVSVRVANSSLIQKEKIWTDDLLFTHKGLSGPAILCASLYYTDDSILKINFLPERDFQKLMDETDKRTARSLLRGLLPQRLADLLLKDTPCGHRIVELPRKTRTLMAQKVNCFQIGKLKPGGMESAEVCSGGVSLEELSPSSMESKLIPNLYICGEMQDVTGELGGYNIHWAFASAFLAIQHILAKLNRKPPLGGSYKSGAKAVF